MTPTGLVAGFVLAALFIAFVILLRGCDKVSADQQPEPPEPSTPPIRYPVPRQRADTERLLMSPDQRAYEVDQLHAIWAASSDEDVQTDLRANPGPHEPA